MSSQCSGHLHQADIPVPLPSWALYTGDVEGRVDDGTDDAQPAAENEMIVVYDLSEQELNDLLTYMDNLGICDDQVADEDV